MARIRSLKPEIWMSPQVMNLSHSARLLFVGLITQADDDGRGTADPRRVKASIFGGDDIDSASVRRWLDEIVAQRLIVVYPDEKHGDLYSIPTWRHHQKIDKPKPGGYPAPPNPGPVVEQSSTSRRGSEGGREGSSGGRDLQDGSEGGISEPSDENDSENASPPKEPSNPKRGNGRHVGDFEAINEAVTKLLAAGACKAGDYKTLARLAHVSELQAEISVRQLRDRGKLPAVAA